jgi:hypothetical protein
MKERDIGTPRLPESEHSIGLYLGLLIGAVILFLGSGIILVGIYSIFREEGISFSTPIIARLALFVITIFSAFAAFSAFLKMFKLERFLGKKSEREFKDFLYFARPLLEEVIRQRLVTQQLVTQVEQIRKEEKMAPGGAESTRWNEFLFFVAILSTATVGLFLFITQNPWRIIPYSVIFMAIAWYIVMAYYFGLLWEPKSYYIPAIFILIIPSLAILMRSYINIDQANFLVFILLGIYILTMYAYYSQKTMGRLPFFLPARLRGAGSTSEESAGKNTQINNGGVSSKLQEYMPPNNKRE